MNLLLEHSFEIEEPINTISPAICSAEEEEGLATPVQQVEAALLAVNAVYLMHQDECCPIRWAKLLRVPHWAKGTTRQLTSYWLLTYYVYRGGFSCKWCDQDSSDEAIEEAEPSEPLLPIAFTSVPDLFWHEGWINRRDSEVEGPKTFGHSLDHSAEKQERVAKWFMRYHNSRNVQISFELW